MALDLSTFTTRSQQALASAIQAAAAAGNPARFAPNLFHLKHKCDLAIKEVKALLDNGSV